jgi:hypothetical protein
MAYSAWRSHLPLSFIADKNPVWHGTVICGIPVISPEESVGKADIYIIAALIHEQDIRHDIGRLHMGLSQPEIVLRTEL